MKKGKEKKKGFGCLGTILLLLLILGGGFGLLKWKGFFESEKFHQILELVDKIDLGDLNLGNLGNLGTVETEAKVTEEEAVAFVKEQYTNCDL